MQTPKKVIPSLAVAALPLTGAACSGQSPAENLTNAVRAFCMKAVACEYYQDLDSCLAENEPYIQDYVDNYSGACVNVIASYLDCLSKLTCAELDSGDDDCFANLEDEFIAACDL